MLELYGQEDSRNSDRLLDLSRGPAQFGLHDDLPAGDEFSASKGLAPSRRYRLQRGNKLRYSLSAACQKYLLAIEHGLDELR